MDEDDLQLFAREHLSYEVWMLDETAALLINMPAEASLVARNALLESFGIHARALGAFLANKGRRKDDVLAKDYSPGWVGDDPNPGLTETVNKQVALLTKVRLGKPPINPWDVRERVVAGFRRFIDTLPEARHEWFDWFR